MSNQALVPLVSIENGQPTTTSLDVAEFFHKRHDNVIRDIEKLRAESDATHLLNFEEVSNVTVRPDGTRIETPAYILTRAGFVMLAMGFSGKKAQDFKWAYIDAFDAMEAKLREDHLIVSGLSKALDRICPDPPRDPPGVVSKRMVKTLRALAAYWAMREGIPQETAEAAACVVGGIQKLDDFDGDNDKFWPMFSFLDCLVAHCDKDTEPATEQQLDTIKYLLDACNQTLYVRDYSGYKQLEVFYGITTENILTATQGQARRIADMAYTILKQYDALTYIVMQIKKQAKKLEAPKKARSRKRVAGGKQSTTGEPKEAAPGESQP